MQWHIHIDTHTQKKKHKQTKTHARTHARTYRQTDTRTQTHTHTRTHARTHTHTHTHTRTHAHKHTHTQAHTYWRNFVIRRVSTNLVAVCEVLQLMERHVPLLLFIGLVGHQEQHWLGHGPDRLACRLLLHLQQLLEQSLSLVEAVATVNAVDQQEQVTWNTIIYRGQRV